MKILLMYDISEGHKSVKKALLEDGYKDTVPTKSGKISLPNTTLCKIVPNPEPNTLDNRINTLKQANKDFAKIIERIEIEEGIKIVRERVYLAQDIQGYGIPGIEHVNE